MNFTKGLAELGNKMQNELQKTKEHADALKEKTVKMALASAKQTDNGSVPTEIDALSPPSYAEEPPPFAVDPTTPKKNIAMDKLSEFTSALKFKPSEEEQPVSDLVEVLARIFDFDPRAKKPHEMVESLDIQGIHTWRAFLLMAEEDIMALTKNTREYGEVPISQNSIRMLTYLKNFTMTNINAGVEGAKDPEFYTSETFDAYVEDLQLGRKSAFDKDEAAEAAAKSDRAMKLPDMSGMRDSVSGFASKLKPGINIHEGSIADILSKAKDKVSLKKGGNGATAEDDVSVLSMSETTDLAMADPEQSESAFEAMKKNVDELASKLESTAKEMSGKSKEQVQKSMVPLLAKLKTSQDKFEHMIEVRKQKAAEKKAQKAAAAAEAGEDEAPSEDAAAEKEENKRFAKLLSSAENATKMAFQNAEKVARQAATKAGILESDDNKEGAAAPAESADGVNV